MDVIQVEIQIPYIYVDLTDKYTMQGKMFKLYVLGYMARSFPHLKPIQIDTKRMLVICKKREGE